MYKWLLILLLLISCSSNRQAVRQLEAFHKQYFQEKTEKQFRSFEIRMLEHYCKGDITYEEYKWLLKSRQDLLELQKETFREELRKSLKQNREEFEEIYWR